MTFRYTEEYDHEEKEYTPIPSKKVTIVERSAKLKLKNRRAYITIVASTVQPMGGDINTMPASVNST